jgi:16S rRNA (guanine966-N2)-methyltransferase
MRVISGSAKGRRLVAPKGGAVRPTAGKVKESLFNILPRDFSGMRVLDLFAGSGNISIEALSRGAAEAVLVDASARSAAVIRENLRRLDLAERSQVWVLAAPRALRTLGQQAQVFDLIFIDPPYEQRLVGATLELIAKNNLLAVNGTVVAEHSRREPVNSEYGPLILNDQRRYGDTLLTFFKAAARPDSAV